jgi:hypothetical protein
VQHVVLCPVDLHENSFRKLSSHDKPPARPGRLPWRATSLPSSLLCGCRMAVKEDDGETFAVFLVFNRWGGGGGCCSLLAAEMSGRKAAYTSIYPPRTHRKSRKNGISNSRDCIQRKTWCMGPPVTTLSHSQLRYSAIHPH